MLAYVLALVVGLSSVALYMAAFFFPEVHRKNDFIWSGVGLFYALVLWVCAGRITGGVLLGQTASVALLGWLGWQTLSLRRQVAPLEQQTAVPSSAEWRATLSNALSNLSSSETIAPFSKPLGRQFAKLTAWLEALVTTTTKPTSAPPPQIEPPYVPLTPADFANAGRSAEPGRAEQVTDTIVSEVTPISTSSSSAQAANPLTAITKQVQGAFQGLTQKRESKPVYVRKQFRTPEAEPEPTVAFESEVVDAVPEPVPPNPPDLEIVEAAIADANEKGLPTSPPTVIDSNPASDVNYSE